MAVPDSFKDMLPNKKIHMTIPQRDKGKKRTRDTWFCAPFQKIKCTLDSPYMAKVGTEGTERQVHHYC